MTTPQKHIYLCQFVLVDDQFLPVNPGFNFEDAITRQLFTGFPVIRVMAPCFEEARDTALLKSTDLFDWFGASTINPHPVPESYSYKKYLWLKITPLNLHEKIRSLLVASRTGHHPVEYH